MRWILAIMLLIPAGGPVHQDSVLERMRIAYCYSSYSATSQKTTVSAEARTRAKANADLLFPRYQRALEESRGTLAEVALQTEATKASSTGKRDLSAAEVFMIRESCDRLVVSGEPQPQ